MSAEFDRGWELVRLRRPKEAAAIALDLVAEDPRDEEGHLLLAFAKIAMGDRRGALASAREAVACAPESAYAHYVLAYVSCRARRYREGLAAAGQSLALDPDLACSHDLAASIHMALEDPFAALTAATRAVRLAPEDPDYHATRTRILRALEREEDAISSVTAGLRAEPNHAGLNAHFGHLHLTRDPAAAEQAFLTALRADPAQVEARNGLLATLRNRNRVYRLLLPARRGIAAMLRRGQLIVVLVGLLIATAGVSVIVGPSVGKRLCLAAVVTLFVSTDLGNALLLLHPMGKHLLGRLNQVFAIVVTGLFVAAAGICLLALLQEEPRLGREAERLGAAAFGCSLMRLALDEVRFTGLGKVVFGLVMGSLLLLVHTLVFGR